MPLCDGSLRCEFDIFSRTAGSFDKIIRKAASQRWPTLPAIVAGRTFKNYCDETHKSSSRKLVFYPDKSPWGAASPPASHPAWLHQQGGGARIAGVLRVSLQHSWRAAGEAACSSATPRVSPAICPTTVTTWQNGKISNENILRANLVVLILPF